MKFGIYKKQNPFVFRNLFYIAWGLCFSVAPIVFFVTFLDLKDKGFILMNFVLIVSCLIPGLSILIKGIMNIIQQFILNNFFTSEYKRKKTITVQLIEIREKTILYINNKPVIETNFLLEDNKQQKFTAKIVHNFSDNFLKAYNEKVLYGNIEPISLTAYEFKNDCYYIKLSQINKLVIY